MEDNKLIAEFMGVVFHDDENQFYNADGLYIGLELEYHKSWDWLMPVVSKITRDEILIGNEYRESIMDTVPYGLIEDTYKAVVEFIKYYNNENK